MSAMIDISVVIPTYNRSTLLGDTLRAVLSQRLAPREIIVVDDGSEDDTQAVLAGYGNQIRPMRIPNSGDLVPRNTGMRAATKRLVAFCDSDDVRRPDFLAVMAEQWQRELKLVAAYANFRILRDGVLSDRNSTLHPIHSGQATSG
jgi:glycosyltransferase involved in cell wall biosynthesis